MKIIVACGGTGGHAFPGLAVAEELRRRGHDVTIWDAGRDIESSVMKGWSGEVFSTGAKPLKPRYALAILRAILRCRRALMKSRPDALLAMGSYSSLPPVLAARMCRVPVVLHEANTVPGKAVEFLSRFAKCVAISYEGTSGYMPNVRTERTGLPVREAISRGARFDFIPPEAFTVFVTGGSQGAHAVNELMCEALKMLKRELDKRQTPDATSNPRPLYVIHQTGAADEGRIMAAYSKADLPARVHAFEHEMANAFASANVVVARAGASTCFELAACAKPALLIPLPSAMRNHQHFNADAFASKGAADEGVQEKLTPKTICQYLLHKYDHPEALTAMTERMRRLATPDAAARVADLVIYYGESH